MTRVTKVLSIATFAILVWHAGCARHDDGGAAAKIAGPGPADRASGTQPAGSQFAGVEIGIDNFTYSPPELTVPVGTTVQWTNHDDVPHTVTSSDANGSLSSAALDTDDHYSYRFTQPGTYAYFCKVHPHMTGRIIVR